VHNKCARAAGAIASAFVPTIIALDPSAHAPRPFAHATVHIAARVSGKFAAPTGAARGWRPFASALRAPRSPM
jgi:hypothetical protein